MAAYDRRTVKGNVSYTVTLASSVVAGDTTIPISDGSTYPDGSAGPFTITLDPGASGEEKVKIATRTGNSLAVAPSGRGYDGTSAASHASGVKVVHSISAVDLDEANQLVHALLTGGTTGQVAMVDTSLTPPIKLATVAVASSSGVLGGDVPIAPVTKVKVMDTASLAAGTWMVTFALSLAGAGSNSDCDFVVEADTATASLAGPQSGTIAVPSFGADEASGSVTTLVTVTVAGTIKLSAFGGTSGATAKAATNSQIYAGATGYTAWRVA